VPPDAKIRLRHELGIARGERIVGAVGNLYEVKGHRYLLEAVPGILRACPRTTFLIAGRGELEEPLRSQARRLGIDARVRFLGLRPDIPALLSLCDVFVQPSLSEGLSVAILEAMAAALPVVTTRVGGNPELVVDGETGVLVEQANPRQLADAVTRLLTDSAEARRLGDNGLRRVTNRFTVAAMVDAYQAIYEACLDRRPHSAREGGPTAPRVAGRLAG
jgi:glycosyltransferase involved in cell wall biosynthesis